MEKYQKAIQNDDEVGTNTDVMRGRKVKETDSCVTMETS
jgi:hypothetical protein